MSALRWLPWLLAAVALTTFPVVLGGSGVLLALIWFVVLLAYRWLVGGQQPRGRLVANIVFGALCFLAGFEGGWYVLPAVLAFAYGDWRGVDSVTRVPARLWQGPLALTLAAAFAGWLAIVVVLFAPLYAMASSTVAPGLAPAPGITGTVNLVDLGLRPQAGLLLGSLAVLFALAVAAAVLFERSHSRAARRLLVAIAVLLASVVLIGAWTIGPWLLPSLALLLAAIGTTRGLAPTDTAS